MHARGIEMQNDLLRCDQSEVDFLLSIYNSKWEEEALQCGDAAGLVFDIDIPILPLPSVNADICASEACQMLYETMGNFETPELPNCEIDGMSSREALLMLLRQAIESWSTCTDFNIQEAVVPVASTEAATDNPTASTASTVSIEATTEYPASSTDESTDDSSGTSTWIYILAAIAVIVVIVLLVSCSQRGELDDYNNDTLPMKRGMATNAGNYSFEEYNSPKQAPSTFDSDFEPSGNNTQSDTYVSGYGSTYEDDHSTYEPTYDSNESSYDSDENSSEASDYNNNSMYYNAPSDLEQGDDDDKY